MKLRASRDMNLYGGRHTVDWAPKPEDATRHVFEQTPPVPFLRFWDAAAAATRQRRCVEWTHSRGTPDEIACAHSQVSALINGMSLKWHDSNGVVCWMMNRKNALCFCKGSCETAGNRKWEFGGSINLKAGKRGKKRQKDRERNDNVFHLPLHICC